MAARAISARCYSSGLPYGSLQKWRLEGLPTPRSILEDDSDVSLDLSEDVESEETRSRPTGRPSRKPTPISVLKHKAAIKKSFANGWNPPRKLSREAMEGLRELYRLDKDRFNAPFLAERFRISPEAVTRILKSKWQPSSEQVVKNVVKQRLGYQAYREERRLKEETELHQALLHSKDGQMNPRHADQEKPSSAVRGINAKDTFTFQ